MLVRNKYDIYINLEYTQKITALDKDMFKLLIEEDSNKPNALAETSIRKLFELTNRNFNQRVYDKNSLFLVTIEIKANDYTHVLSQFQNGEFRLDMHLSTLSTNLDENADDQPIVELFKQEMPIKIDAFERFCDKSSIFFCLLIYSV